MSARNWATVPEASSILLCSHARGTLCLTPAKKHVPEAKGTPVLKDKQIDRTSNLG